MKQGEGGFPCQGKAPCGNHPWGAPSFHAAFASLGTDFAFPKFGTARKIHMEPKNHPFRKENGLEKNLPFFLVHVNFRGNFANGDGAFQEFIVHKI